MDAYEKKTGGKALAIPHNSNVSNGMMFEMVGPGGGAMSADYARRRAAREPLVEATQIKGDSEAHPFLSPNDEFAGFGDAGWDIGNLTMQAKKTPDMLGGDYVREALKRGLAIEAKTGVNPYKFGLIGSTDSHTGLATADEDNFFGKHSGGEPNAKRASAPQNLGTREGRFGWHYLAGGYAAVWATANTRAAIFDAMMRKEVYATTGPRMQVRVFGGWDFSEKDWAGDWVKAGYARGVPMGADLKAGSGKPSLIISALKDPDGANLDRVQVVKGWVDGAGKLHEKVFDVVWSSPEKRTLGWRKTDPRWRYRGHRQGELYQQHRRARIARRVERSGIRCGPKRLLLCPRARNPDAALGVVRCVALWCKAVAGNRAESAGTGLYLADLVCAEGLAPSLRLDLCQHRIGIGNPHQPPHREARQPLYFHLAPSRRQRNQSGRAEDFGVIGIRDDQPGSLGQKGFTFDRCKIEIRREQPRKSGRNNPDIRAISDPPKGPRAKPLSPPR